MPQFWIPWKPVSPAERFQESVRHLMDGLVSGLIEGTVAFARVAGVADVEAVRHFPSRIVRFTDETAVTCGKIKNLLHRLVYSSADLAEDRRRSMERLARLFGYLMAHPDLVPTGSDAKPTLQRAVCDYIAGMTDGYFLRVYTALLG
jgi:dGTPase